MRDFHLPGRSSVLAENGLCATSHPLAAQAALDILKRGGNAMDAAIAGAVLLGICEPAMTGIGGDCFVLFSPAGSDDILALNGSGRAPAAADAQALRDQGLQAIDNNSAHAVTIPGAIDAFCTLSNDHGRLGLDAVLAPAIHYAEHGVRVAPRVAFDWEGREAILTGDAATWYLKDGRGLKTGDLSTAPGQAEVLRRIARDGRDGFYDGEVAEDMISALRAWGGVHEGTDFSANSPTPTTAISGAYRDRDLFEHPPNGQGATAILMLNMLAQFELSGLDPLGAKRAHIEAEIGKLAYAERDRIIADPQRTQDLEQMLSPELAKSLAGKIDLKRAQAAPPRGPGGIHRDTVYITVVDKDRMAVSLIYSIFDGFGSGIATEKFGILMQSRGAGFNLIPGHPNELTPNARPFHTIIPAMLAQGGHVEMPFGVMGGHYQPAGHVRVLSNLLDFGMDLQSSLDAPRSFAADGTLAVERGYTNAVCHELADLGHELVVPRTPIGGAQAIRIDQAGYLEGASDPRKDGCAIRY